MSDDDALPPDLEDLAFEVDAEQARRMHQALERARAAEDFQAKWSAAADLLELAFEANLEDPDLLDRFDRMTERLAEGVAVLEPELASVWDDSLAHLLSDRVVGEVTRARQVSEELRVKYRKLWFKRHLGADLEGLGP